MRLESFTNQSINKDKKLMKLKRNFYSFDALNENVVKCN